MEITSTILEEWNERIFPEIIGREIDLSRYINSKLNKIIALSGFRRVGKTYLMLNEIKKLLGDKSKKEVVYFNFEDERIPLKTEFLSDFFPGVVRANKEIPKFVFLDELANFPDWSKWLRRVYDQYSTVRFFVTGSSSKMTSSKIPTELRGRYILKKIFPLSFREFLKFKNIGENESKNKIIGFFDEYLFWGGLPEVVLSDESQKTEIVRSYYSSVVNRDLIDNYSISNKESLKAILNLLLNSTSFSYNKLYNSLKGLSYKIGKNTVAEYVGFIEDSFFMFSVPIFSHKIKDRMQYPKKNYFIDNVFLSKVSTQFSDNYGRLYENLVAIELLKTEKEFFYWKNEKGEEVDFVIFKDKKVGSLVQVCYDIRDADTLKREIRSLLKASEELGCDNLVIINKESEKTADEEWFGVRKKVRYVPLWKVCRGDIEEYLSKDNELKEGERDGL